MKKTYCDVSGDDIPDGRCAVEHPIAARIAHDALTVPDGITLRLLVGVGVDIPARGLLAGQQCIGKGNLSEKLALGFLIGEVLKRRGEEFGVSESRRLLEEILVKFFPALEADTANG